MPTYLLLYDYCGGNALSCHGYPYDLSPGVHHPGRWAGDCGVAQSHLLSHGHRVIGPPVGECSRSSPTVTWRWCHWHAPTSRCRGHHPPEGVGGEHRVRWSTGRQDCRIPTVLSDCSCEHGPGRIGHPLSAARYDSGSRTPGVVLHRSGN